MYEGRTVGVVVPAYNEGGLVGSVIDTMPTFVDRIYVVDDRSTDGTWEEVLDHAASMNENRDPADRLADGGEAGFVVPIRHEENRGPGGARKTGYERALADGIDVIATMDADGQMDPDHLHRIIEPVVAGRVDYAKGTRLASREFWREMPPFRLFGNLLLTFLTKVASGYWGMTDPQNGYTAISHDALVDVGIESLYDDYGYLNDVLTSLNIRSKRIADVSHPARYGHEHSGIRYSTFVPLLSAVLLRNFGRRLRDRYLLFDFNPLVFLYGLSGAGFLSSGASFCRALWARGVGSGRRRSRSSATDGGIDPHARHSRGRTAYGSRSAATRCFAALRSFLFAAVTLLLAIVFDTRANDDLVIRIDRPVAADRDPSSVDSPEDP